MQTVNLPDNILGLETRKVLYELQKVGVLEETFVGGSLSLVAQNTITRQVHDIDLNTRKFATHDEVLRLIDKINKVGTFLGHNKSVSMGYDDISHYRWKTPTGVFICLFENEMVQSSGDVVYLEHNLYPIYFRTASIMTTYNGKLGIISNRNANPEQRLKHGRDISEFYRKNHPDYQ